MQKLRQRYTDLIRHWVLRRQGVDAQRTTLHRKRIYILPTKSGLVFALLVFIMLLASMNYSSSPGFALTFLLASLGFVAMHHCHAILDGLELETGRITPVFCGQTQYFHINVRNDGRRARPALQLSTDHGETGPLLDLGPDSEDVLELPVRTGRRGWNRPGRLRLATTHPFGLFRAWTWLHMDLRGLVYPRPAEPSTNPPVQNAGEGRHASDETGLDDFRGLRDYRESDSPRHIAWRSFARTDELQVKQFEETRDNRIWIDWDALDTRLGEERRLSILCRQVLDANGRGDLFGLRIPGKQIPPARSESHTGNCLEALALWNRGDDTSA